MLNKLFTSCSDFQRGRTSKGGKGHLQFVPILTFPEFPSKQKKIINKKVTLLKMRSFKMGLLV